MSVTAGSVFQDSHLPLVVWLRAIWQVASQKNGISAQGLQRVLGLGSYKTAWTMLHKLRRTMVRPGCDRLSSVVEVDETYRGAEEPGLIGRLTENKVLVAYGALMRSQYPALQQANNEMDTRQYVLCFRLLGLHLALVVIAIQPRYDPNPSVRTDCDSTS
jgi:hypothetical protein